MTIERFKAYDNVFDRYTLSNLEKLAARHVFDELRYSISSGKEANIYAASAKDRGKVIVKIYRVQSCNFNKMFDYLKKDIRFTGLRKQKRKIIFEWTRREYRNLIKARELGVDVPTPLELLDNILVLEFIGNKETAPPLKDIAIKTMHRKDKEGLLLAIADNMRKMHEGGIVHGDLSSFNILIHNNKPILIDFSQSTLKNNIQYKELLERDIKNVSSFFKRNGLEDAEETLRNKILGEKRSDQV
ncbi:MAG: serine protein kinase RIO [Candidatus Woesearchaeota archaeon]